MKEIPLTIGNDNTVVGTVRIEEETVRRLEQIMDNATFPVESPLFECAFVFGRDTIHGFTILSQHIHFKPRDEA